MTRLLRGHPSISVEIKAGQVVAIAWANRREPVEVCNRWRVEESWWREPIARDYVRRGWASRARRRRGPERAHLTSPRSEAELRDAIGPRYVLSEDRSRQRSHRRPGATALETGKGPKEPTRGVGIDAIAAVSLRSTPPG
jgi:hypothetical protein